MNEEAPETPLEKVTSMIRRLSAAQGGESLRTTLIEAMELFNQIYEEQGNPSQNNVQMVKNTIQQVRDGTFTQRMSLETLKEGTLGALQDLKDELREYQVILNSNSAHGGQRNRKTRRRKQKRSRRARKYTRKS